MNDRPASYRWTAAAAAAILVAVLFVIFSGVDLWFTGMFWDASRGFFLGETWWARAMYDVVPVLAYGTAGAAIIGLVVTALRRKPVGKLGSRAFLYIIIVLAVGPGLVVNVVLKDHWGRARPRDVIEFGGDKTFTPAFVISDQCPRNCSFVAGHPSMAFALVALGLLAIDRPRRRTWLVGSAVVLGVLVGFGRIVQGGHFLSDVVFSGVFTLAVVFVLHRAFGLLREPAPAGGCDDDQAAA